MLKFPAELGPLAYVVCALGALALVCLGRNIRAIWFVVVVASTVAMALGASKGRRGALVVQIGDVGSLTFRPKHRR